MTKKKKLLLLIVGAHLVKMKMLPVLRVCFYYADIYHLFFDRMIQTLIIFQV